MGVNQCHEAAVAPTLRRRRLMYTSSAFENGSWFSSQTCSHNLRASDDPAGIAREVLE